jgi:hypothetical protein
VAAGSGAVGIEIMMDPLFDVPLEQVMAEQNLRYGQMAVVIHQGEDWPAGRFCRNCHARFPCRLALWGARVLEAAGWTTVDVAHMLGRAKSGDVPWL